MKMEKERGISVTSSVLQFEYDGRALNLLDTPGHADFSEDTFRVLAAVDSAVMLMDHVKGVEPRTLKLFEVCRMRRLPVVTFMNKLDREGMEPFELLDDVSTKLDLKVAPLTWPIGMGRDFRGDDSDSCFARLPVRLQLHDLHPIRIGAQRVALERSELSARRVDRIGGERIGDLAGA